MCCALVQRDRQPRALTRAAGRRAMTYRSSRCCSLSSATSRRQALASVTAGRAGSNWPALPAVTDASAWRRDVALLKEQHRLLRYVIARLPAARVSARGWRSRWTNAQHIYGIASHDLYHAGQIQLLKVLSRQS